MTGVVVVLTILAGGLGAVARFVVDSLVRARSATTFPIGTLVINVTGSFVLGLITGVVLAAAAPDAWRTVVGTGFLGGYTTFSTASFETVRLVEQQRYRAAAAYGLGTLVTTTGVAAFGVWLGLLA